MAWASLIPWARRVGVRWGLDGPELGDTRLLVRVGRRETVLVSDLQLQLNLRRNNGRVV